MFWKKVKVDGGAYKFYGCGKAFVAFGRKVEWPEKVARFGRYELQHLSCGRGRMLWGLWISLPIRRGNFCAEVWDTEIGILLTLSRWGRGLNNTTGLIIRPLRDAS